MMAWNDNSVVEYQVTKLPILTVSVHTVNSINTPFALTRGNFAYAQIVEEIIIKIKNSATALLAYLSRFISLALEKKTSSAYRNLKTVFAGLVFERRFPKCWLATIPGTIAAKRNNILPKVDRMRNLDRRFGWSRSPSRGWQLKRSRFQFMENIPGLFSYICTSISSPSAANGASLDGGDW